LNVAIFFLYALLAYSLSRIWEVTGVVLALAVAYTVLAILSLAATRREIGLIDGQRILRSLLKIFVAGTIMYVVARVGTSLVGTGSDFTERLLVLVAVGGISLAVYIAVAFVLKTEELESATALLRRRSTGKAAG
jgi:putative peptidoglycan lipid II flippase